MKIAITDTNIFIDLLEVDLLGFLFEMGYEIHTTLEVFNEFYDHQKEKLTSYIDNGTLNVKVFTSDEIEQIIELSISSGLSFQDKGLFYYASQNQEFKIFTSDNLLRKTCQQHGIAINGILWIFDKFIELEKTTPTRMVQALEKLTCRYHRLPKEECKKRLALWK